MTRETRPESWPEVLERRRGEIDGETVLPAFVDQMERYVRACPARDAISAMLRRFPIVHARIFFGPPLPNGMGPEHELLVMDPGLIDACANDLRPGGFVIGAGYVAFASDADNKDQHFVGPHPETGELTVLQIFRKRVRQVVQMLRPDQYQVHAPSLAAFFEECEFAPQVRFGHPPRK